MRRASRDRHRDQLEASHPHRDALVCDVTRLRNSHSKHRRSHSVSWQSGCCLHLHLSRALPLPGENNVEPVMVVLEQFVLRDQNVDKISIFIYVLMDQFPASKILSHLLFVKLYLI